MTRNYYITILFAAIPMTALMMSCRFGAIPGFILGLSCVAGYVLAGFWLGKRWNE